MTKASNNPFPSVLINHQSNTAIATPDPIHSRLFVDSDGTLKTKDWNGTVTGVGSNFTSDAITIHAGESNPHSGYILKSVATANYDILIGTGASTVGALNIGASNTLLGTSNALVYNPVGTSTFAPDSLSAGAAPSVTDDYSAGWRRGSKWIYAGTLYICTDETPGAAQWQEVGAGAALEVTDGGVTVSTTDKITFSSNFAVTDQGAGDALVDIYFPGGGGGAALDVTDTITTVSSTDKITFASNFVVTDEGANDARVNIYFPGGGGGASAMDDLTDADTTTVAPTSGDPLVWDGTNWVPGTATTITTGTIGASMSTSGTVAIANSSFVKVTFDTTDFDTNSFISSSTMTVPTGEGGKYLITYKMRWNNTSGGQRVAYVYINGAASDADAAVISGSTAAFHRPQGAYVADLSAGDTVELYAYQSDTGDEDLLSGTYIQMVKLSASITGSSGLPTDTASATGGDYSLTTSGWKDLDSALDLTVAAEAGDVLAVSVSGRFNSEAASAGLDAATMVSSSPVNYVSGDTAGASDWGVGGWFCGTGINGNVGTTVLYTVQSGDIASGTVTLRLRYRAGGTKTLYANTENPFQWSVANLRAVGAPRATVGDGAPSNPAVGQLWYDSDASPSGAGGTGTSFPTSPTTGDTYRRSDLDYITFFYDGTRWVSEEIFHAVENTAASSASGITSSVGRNVAVPVYGFTSIYVLDVEGDIYDTGANDASNKWDITWETGVSANFDTTVGTLTTEGETSSVYNHLSAAVNSVVTVGTGSSYPAWKVNWTETGNGGTLLGVTSMHYRLIAT